MSNKQKGTKKEQAIEKICNLISHAYETKDNKWIAEMLYNGIIERIGKVAVRTAKELFVKVEEIYKKAEAVTTGEPRQIGYLDALLDVLDVFHQDYGFEMEDDDD